MPISVVCDCGRKASVPDAMAGKKGKCPACGSIIAIPDVIEDDEPEPVSTAPLPPRSAPPAPTPVTTVVPAPVAVGPRVRVRCIACNGFMMVDATADRSGLKCRSCGVAYGTGGAFIDYEPTVQFVHLVDAEMPFYAMFLFCLKWTFAALPSAFIVGIIGGLVYAVVTSMMHTSR